MRRTTPSGFTLIEIVAALAIIAIGLVGLAALFPLGISASRDAGDTSVVAMLAQAKLDEIRMAAEATWDPAIPEPDHFNDLTATDDDITWYKFGDEFEPQNEDDERVAFADNPMYEYSIEFRDVVRGDDEMPGSEDNPRIDELCKVVIRVYWPRARGSNIADAKAKQKEFVLMTYIRPNTN